MSIRKSCRPTADDTSRHRRLISATMTDAVNMSPRASKYAPPTSPSRKRWALTVRNPADRSLTKPRFASLPALRAHRSRTRLVSHCGSMQAPRRVLSPHESANRVLLDVDPSRLLASRRLARIGGCTAQRPRHTVSRAESGSRAKTPGEAWESDKPTRPRRAAARGRRDSRSCERSWLDDCRAERPQHPRARGRRLPIEWVFLSSGTSDAGVQVMGDAPASRCRSRGARGTDVDGSWIDPLDQ